MAYPQSLVTGPLKRNGYHVLKESSSVLLAHRPAREGHSEKTFIVAMEEIPRAAAGLPLAHLETEFGKDSGLPVYTAFMVVGHGTKDVVIADAELKACMLYDETLLEVREFQP
jgi:hypothetical protein